MYAILAEDRSDFDTLKTLVVRISQKKKTPSVLGKGYDGCGDLLKKGARDLQLYAKRACNRFVVCYDSDRDDPKDRKEKILSQVIAPSHITDPICILVPVQEIEAWILADLDALQKVIPSWRNAGRELPNPEQINDPKEYLTKLTRLRGRPLYANAAHNPAIAKHLDIAKLLEKCPSFRPLTELVLHGNGNLQD